MLLTMIVPCHNSTEYLDDCFNSIVNQTIGIENLQIIMVDDASDDNGATMEKLLGYEKLYPEQVDIIALEHNLRQGGARNVALKYAQGKYVQFLDSDDQLQPDSCKYYYNMAEQYDVDFIHYYPKYYEDDRLIDLSLPEVRKQFLASAKYSCGHSMKFYKRKLLERAGSSFAEHCIFEEPKFVYPLYLYAQRILFLKENKYIVRLHEKSTMASEAVKKLLDHPRVQLQLLEFLMGRPEVFNEYKDEIEDYFIWSFFCETMINNEKSGDILLGATEKCWLIEVCHKLFPDCKNNQYIKQYTGDAARFLDML